MESQISISALTLVVIGGILILFGVLVISAFFHILSERNRVRDNLHDTKNEIQKLGFKKEFEEWQKKS